MRLFRYSSDLPDYIVGQSFKCVVVLCISAEPPSDSLPWGVAGEAEPISEDAGDPLSQARQGQFICYFPKDGRMLLGYWVITENVRKCIRLYYNIVPPRLFPWYRNLFPTAWVVPSSKRHPSTWVRPLLIATAAPPSSSSSPLAQTPWLHCSSLEMKRYGDTWETQQLWSLLCVQTKNERRNWILLISQAPTQVSKALKSMLALYRSKSHDISECVCVHCCSYPLGLYR